MFGMLYVVCCVFRVAGELDQAAVEEMCEGNFIDLRKAFFLLSGAEAPLVAKVSTTPILLFPKGLSFDSCFYFEKPLSLMSIAKKSSQTQSEEFSRIRCFSFNVMPGSASFCPAGSGSAALASNQRLLQRHRSSYPTQPGRKPKSLQQQRHRLLSQGNKPAPDQLVPGVQS